MAVTIDEVSAEVEDAAGGAGNRGQQESGSSGSTEKTSEAMLKDQLCRHEKRQLRLMAD
jgi:hypothetical protein